MATVFGGRLGTANLAEVMQVRRSIRQVTDQPPVDRDRVEKAIQLALHAPSAFNMQSSRLVVLIGSSHKKLWDIVEATLRRVVPPEKFGQTQERLQGLRNGAGTVLFFEDLSTIKNWQESAPLYKDHFPAWSEQGSGMLQYALWLAFTADGIGASLQHYNPLIDDEVKATWGISKDWKLITQMVFGNPAEHPQVPSHLPVDQVVQWH